MNSLERAIRRSRRRSLLNLAGRSVGRGAALGIAGGILLLLLDRLLGLALPAWVFAIPAAGGALAGLVRALLDQPDRLGAAVNLDRQLGLKDRIGTAEAIGRVDMAREPFAALALVDARRLAERLDVRRAVPLQVSAWWAVVVPGILALWLGVLFLPIVQWSNGAVAPPDAAQLSELKRASQDMAATLNEAAQTLASAESAASSPEHADALQRLAEQMASREFASQDELRTARDESAAQLQRTATDLEDQAQRDLAAADEVTRQFRSWSSPGADAPMTARQFTEALRRGDFGDAADLLEQMKHDRSTLSPAERERIAEELRQLGRHVEQTGQPEESALQQQAGELLESLRQQGVDESTARELTAAPQESEQNVAPDAQQRLREQGVDEDVARRLAKELKELAENQKLREQVQEQAGELAKQLDETARQMTPPPADLPDHQSSPQQPGSDQAAPPREQKPQQQGSDQQTPDQSRQQSSSSRQNGSQPKPAQANELPRQGSQDPQAQPQPTPETPGAPGAPEAPGEPTPSPSSPKKQPVAVPDQKQTPQPTGKLPGSSSPGPDQARQDQQREGNESPQPDQTSPPAPISKQLPKPSRTAADLLRRLQEQRDGAPQRQADSQALRQLAERLAGQMTDKEKQELARWARQWQRERGRQEGASGDGSEAGTQPGTARAALPPSNLTPERVDTVDARGPQNETGDRLLAQWLADHAEESSPNHAAPSEQVVRKAQRAAERAVNESAVPSRYRAVIQRYFGRLPATLDQAARTPTTPSDSSNSGGNGR